MPWGAKSITSRDFGHLAIIRRATVIFNTFLVVGIGMLLSMEFAGTSAAHPKAQSQPAAQSGPSLASKDQSGAKKVWGEDDLASVRKPWDVHQDEKAAAL